MCLPAVPAAGASANVDIVDFAFNPASVTIHVNDSVVWTWIGPTVHTATSDTGLWDSGLLNTPGAKFTHTFSSTGSFPYFCEVHPFMTASVTVQTPPNNPPTVSITSPVAGATFPAPWTGPIQATVGDSDGSVTQVVFMAGSTVLGTIANPPPNASLNVSLGAGTYSLTAVATDNAGASTTSASVSVTVTQQSGTNAPPTITITSPVEGAVLPAPWTGTIQVTDGDSDGTVSEIDFKAGPTLLGTILNPPATASLNVTNLAAGSYTLTAVATDNAGASTASIPVHITVGQTNQPPPSTNLMVQLVSPLALDPQTGLLKQSVTVTNGTGSAVAAVRLSVLDLPADVVLYDASGSTNGMPFVEYRRALNPGATVAFLLEYYRSNRLEFVATNFIATAVPLSTPAAPAGTVLQLDRAPFLSNGSLVIEFASVPGKSYVVEYSANMQTWTPAVPPVIAAGTRVQWTDSGPPKTDSAPGATGGRFYRVVQLP